MHRCPECGEIAAEPRLRYCEQCGARMPEFKPAALAPDGAAGLEGAAPARPAKPPYTGPKWLEHVPAHSPTVLGVMLHLVALGLSILPTLAGVGPFWAPVMVLGGLLVVAREYRASGEVQPLVEWIPEKLHPRFVPAVYTALAMGLTLPMLELSVQPLLWLAGTLLVLRDQWAKVFAGPGGYAEFFDHRALVRVPQVVGFAGIVVCLLSLFFTWKVEGEVTRQRAYAIPGVIRALDAQRPPSDMPYGGVGGLRKSGLDLPVAPTVELGLLALLVLLMLKPQVERPVWLRFVPIGVTVIAIAWALANLRMKVGPVMFLAGLVPVGLMSVLQALGREELPAQFLAGKRPPEEEPLMEEVSPSMRDDFPTEDANFSAGGPKGEEDSRG